MRKAAKALLVEQELGFSSGGITDYQIIIGQSHIGYSVHNVLIVASFLAIHPLLLAVGIISKCQANIVILHAGMTANVEIAIGVSNYRFRNSNLILIRSVTRSGFLAHYADSLAYLVAVAQINLADIALHHPGQRFIRSALRNNHQMIESVLCLVNAISVTIKIGQLHLFIVIENALFISRHLGVAPQIINSVVDQHQSVLFPFHLHQLILNVSINHILISYGYPHALAVNVFQTQLGIILQRIQLVGFRANLQILARQILQVLSNRFRLRRCCVSALVASAAASDKAAR